MKTDLRELQTLLAEAQAVLLPILIAPDETTAAGIAEELSALGSGQISIVRRVDDLPRLTRAQIDDRASPIRAGPHTTVQLAPLTSQTLTSSWPPVQAYPVTRARLESTVHLMSGAGDPLLASWQPGAGRVVSVTPGLGAWTSAWLADPTSTQNLADLLTWTAGRARANALSLSLLQDEGDLKIRAELIDDTGEWRTDQALSATAIAPSGDLLALDLVQTAPGRFEGNIRAVQQGAYEIIVTVGSTVVRQAIWASNHEAQQVRDARVGDLSGVRLLETGAQFLPPDWPRKSWHLQPFLLGMALSIFLGQLTAELRPQWIKRSVRLAHRAKLAIFRGTEMSRMARGG
jgi:hypothetical protein